MADHRFGLGREEIGPIDQVLRDSATPEYGRCALLRRASLRAAGLGAGALLAACGDSASSSGTRAAARTTMPAPRGDDEVKTLVDTAITAEALAVACLTGLIENAEATGVAKFTDVLKAANQAEYDHYRALNGLGATPLTTRFWAPDEIFKPDHVFATLEVAETLCRQRLPPRDRRSSAPASPSWRATPATSWVPRPSTSRSRASRRTSGPTTSASWTTRSPRSTASSPRSSTPGSIRQAGRQARRVL